MSTIAMILTGSAAIWFMFGLEWSVASAFIWALVYCEDIASELRGN